MSQEELNELGQKAKSKWHSLPQHEKDIILEKMKVRRQKLKNEQHETNVEDHIKHMASVCNKEMMQFRQFCCSVCHRMFRKKGVRQLKEETKNTLIKESEAKHKSMIEKCFGFLPKNANAIGEFICHTCYRNLKCGKIPALAIANNLELQPLPTELLNLCDLELQLLALILPFSKIVGLRGGAYQGVKGESVYVPIEPKKISNTITTLPRKLTDPQLIPLKLKRRLRFHGYYMYQTIRKEHVENGLDWLMKNNPLYQSVSKDQNWFAVDQSLPNAESYEKLIGSDLVNHEVRPHEDEEGCGTATKISNIEEAEDEVDGKNLIYDSVFVDEVPTLPVTEDKNSFSIAPGENKIPVSRFTENLDQMANPGIFPYGEASFSLKRDVPLSIGKYYQSLLQRQDSRCSSAGFVFHAQNQVEHNRMQSTINFQSKKNSEGIYQTSEALKRLSWVIKLGQYSNK